jgi:hypothetical protein
LIVVWYNLYSLNNNSVGMESYRCVVCQEEITPKEHSYSTNLFNMALCRKHQDIQKQIRAKAENEQKTKSTTTASKITLENKNFCCVVCQEEITPKEHTYSTNLYNMALVGNIKKYKNKLRQKQKPNKKQIQ